MLCTKIIKIEPLGPDAALRMSKWRFFDIWRSKSSTSGLILMILVPNMIIFNMPSWFSHFPSTSDGRKGSEIEILIFRQICILALCSKTSEGLGNPLDITFLDFFGIFRNFGSNCLWKTSGWCHFQKNWHLGHPIILCSKFFCPVVITYSFTRTDCYFLKVDS